MGRTGNYEALGTRFTELWVPLPRAAEVVRVVRRYFASPADSRESYRRTGLFAYELYGAPPAPGWLHPGHTDGEDEWQDGALRLDVYWFDDNAEDPLQRFFPQFRELLREHSPAGRFWNWPGDTELVIATKN